MTQLLNTFYPETTFGGFSDVDGTLVFYARVRELTGASATVLDVGCGRGAASEDPIPITRLRTELFDACVERGIDPTFGEVSGFWRDFAAGGVPIDG